MASWLNLLVSRLALNVLEQRHLGELPHRVVGSDEQVGLAVGRLEPGRRGTEARNREPTTLTFEAGILGTNDAERLVQGIGFSAGAEP